MKARENAHHRRKMSSVLSHERQDPTGMLLQSPVTRNLDPVARAVQRCVVVFRERVEVPSQCVAQPFGLHESNESNGTKKGRSGGNPYVLGYDGDVPAELIRCLS